ncbi:MAG: hypothetical protein HYR63_08130 [Proteobacteria bacterium]|nr:hypothetical protein [Pseudomonadota bacterium]MBI3497751.1 hypothetical protein [Pseudomonadota bacterium]
MTEDAAPGEDWDAVLLHAADNVATCLKPIAAGAYIRIKAPDGMRTLRARDAVPLFHKIALVPLDAGVAVRKYGVSGAFPPPVRR